MNTHSGNVFLTNADFQVAMMNGNKLETFYTDFETGEEGFKEELSNEALENLGLKWYTGEGSLPYLIFLMELIWPSIVKSN